MIPKTAFFYWSGGPIPWLREQTLRSFQKFHPDWELVLGSPDANLVVPEGVVLVLDDVSDPTLPHNVRSDVWRWHVLGKHGGIYCDMDIIFLRSVEPLFQGSANVWITMDMGTPVPCLGREKRRVERRWVVQPKVRISIGVLGALPGTNFFLRAANIARITPGRRGYFEKNPAASQDYQSHGTHLLAEHWEALFQGDTTIGRIPAVAFYRGSSAHLVKQLWTETGEFGPEEYGVHWYGGSPESFSYQHVKSADELPDCWVRKALGGACREQEVANSGRGQANV